MIDCYASLRHYADHLLPVWESLPKGARGSFYAPRDVCAWFRTPVLVEGLPDRRSTDPVLVAGFADHHTVRPRPTVLLNHGAGQTYAGNPAQKGAESHSGGPGRERVLVHLEWGPLAGRASAEAGLPYAEVGCPYMDPWHRFPAAAEGLIAVAFHHNGRGAAEQMPAWPVFERAFRDLADKCAVLGHGHPRGWGRVENRWRLWGVPSTACFGDVLNRASLLVTDISSVGPLFASTGRPVVWVSAPWHVSAPESGGRFHDWTRAVEQAHGHVTNPADLADTVLHHLFHPSRLVAAQQAIVDDVFAYTDGLAAQRAAAAICAVL